MSSSAWIGFCADRLARVSGTPESESKKSLLVGTRCLWPSTSADSCSTSVSTQSTRRKLIQWIAKGTLRATEAWTDGRHVGDDKLVELDFELVVALANVTEGAATATVLKVTQAEPSHGFVAWQALVDGYAPKSSNDPAIAPQPIHFHRKLKQLFFLFWGGQFSYAVTVSGAGRIIFKAVEGLQFLTRAESIFFYLCSFCRCVVCHVCTCIQNGTFNHCGRSKDSNK